MTGGSVSRSSPSLRRPARPNSPTGNEFSIRFRDRCTLGPQATAGVVNCQAQQRDSDLAPQIDDPVLYVGRIDLADKWRRFALESGGADFAEREFRLRVVRLQDHVYVALG